MKGAIDYFIRNPIVVNLISFMIIVAGVFSAYTLNKEIFPKVEFDVILVTTAYPGSSSEDVEKLITIPIERKIKEVDGIKNLNALSAESNSIIYIEVDPDFDVDDVLEDVKNKVDAVEDLPTDSKVPLITSLANNQKGIISISLYGENYDLLRNMAKELRDEMERVSDISKVELGGYQEDEILIKFSPEKMIRYDVTTQEIKSAIENRNLNLSAGSIKTPSGDIMVRTVAEFKNLEEIENVVIRSNSTGAMVQIKDVANVIRAPTEDGIIQRSMQKQAIFLSVKSKEKSNILTTTAKVKEIVEEYFKGQNRDGANFRYTDDLSYFVKRRLGILVNNGLLGIILVFICLRLFLNLSTSFMASMGAPIAFLISFLVMDAVGISINLISMFALILVLGMLVDDSIIVAEHFYQNLENGMKPKEAARKAAYDTFKPVLATILTTMIAFGSLLFMGGIMGKFLWQVPIVVIICLCASLFECFFILPSHLADFCRLTKNEGRRWYQPIIDFYNKSLKFFLKIPVLTIGAFVVALFFSFFLAKQTRFELFPGDDVRTVFFQIKGEVGDPLSKTDKAMKKLEAVAVSIFSKEELDQIKAQVGVLVGDRGNKTGKHYGSLIAYFTPPDERERSTNELIKAFSEKVKPVLEELGYILTVKEMKGGPPRGKPVEIELTSDSLEDLKKASKEIYKELKTADGMTSSEIDFEEGSDQTVVIVNDIEARRLGLSTRKVAAFLRGSLSGDSITEIRESDEDIEVKIMLDDEARKDLSSLEKLFILNDAGRRIPLMNVVEFEKRPGAFIIRRLNRKRIISVSGTIDKKLETPKSMMLKLSPMVKEIVSKYKYMNFKFGGENEDTNESMVRLAKSGFISMFCIFLILVIMFGSLGQPVIVMSAIPFGLIGVIITFFLTGDSLGFMALMGVVGLVGVVVNDSIVLVNFINKTREKVSDIQEAVLKASLSRLRPVLLTTFTTVAGLLPIAHDPGGDPFLKPMAKSFAWGLLFSTLVTLIFVPCCYLVYGKFIEFMTRKNIIGRSEEQKA